MRQPYTALTLLLLLTLTSALLTGCPQTDSPDSAAPAATAPPPTPAPGSTPPPLPASAKPDSLTAQLEQIKAQSKMDDASKQIMADANAKLERKTWGIPINVPAPTFTLKDSTGKDVSLASYAAKRQPVAVLFYRGEWCPYCNAQLVAMNAIYPQLKAAGGELIAITPEQPEFIAKLVAKHSLAFPVVSDPQSLIAEQYRIAYEVDPAVGGLLGKFGIDLKARNGSDKAMLPHPAVFVLDGAGKVHWSSVNVDYTKRAEPADVLSQVKDAVATTPPPPAAARPAPAAGK